MKNVLLHLLLTALCFYATAQENPAFTWPDGKKAAVCLTYDDAIDCHLDVVIPALDNHRIKATFFLTGSGQSVANRMNEWKSIAVNGHELGNHTLFHPCIKFIEGSRDFEWLAKEYDLDSYTFPQLMAELRTANALLTALDTKSRRTFAYTCVDHTIRGVDFADSIQHLFVAARAAGRVPRDMSSVDLYMMPSTSASEQTGEQLIKQVEQALENGTIATIMFHSVGGGYLNTSAEAHEQLLQFLADHQNELWVDTFGNVTQFIKTQQERVSE